MLSVPGVHTDRYGCLSTVWLELGTRTPEMIAIEDGHICRWGVDERRAVERFIRSAHKRPSLAPTLCVGAHAVGHYVPVDAERPACAFPRRAWERGGNELKILPWKGAL